MKRRWPKWLADFWAWLCQPSDFGGAAVEPVDGPDKPDPAIPQDEQPPTPPIPVEPLVWRNPRIAEIPGEATDFKPYDPPGHPPSAPDNQRRQLSVKWPTCAFDWLRDGHATWATSVPWLASASDTLVIGRNRVATLSAYQVDTGDGAAMRPCYTCCADQVTLAQIQMGDLVALRAKRGGVYRPVYLFRAPNSPTGSLSRVKWQAVDMNLRFREIRLTEREREVLGLGDTK